MLGLLATGGMAEVYLALSGELSGFRTLVVVKRILPHLASNRDFIRMFFDEARIVALLDHPNIVRIIEVGQDRDEYFLAMDLIQGKPLSALIRKALKHGHPLTHAQSAFLVAQAANGLGHAHGLVDAGGLPLNIVHRDVSPQNILVSYSGAVKLIDFGVARVMGRVSATRPGGLKGKIHYMAPEQAASGRVDRRSDIFALGVVLWEAICGRRPFRHETEIETLRAVVEESIPPPSKFVRISARLENIVMRALQRNPADRFQTAQEMALALERYAFGTPDFEPTKIATTMKALFESDYARWKRTAVAVKNLEGEPEQWTNTRGTYLHPQGIDLKTRGSTVALRPVPYTPTPIVATQEIPSVSPSLPSIGFDFSRPLRVKRHKFFLTGAAAVGTLTLAMGSVWFWSGSRHGPPPGRMASEAAAPSPMRVEALPRRSPPSVEATSVDPPVPIQEPPSPKALPQLAAVAPDPGTGVAGVDNVRAAEAKARPPAATATPARTVQEQNPWASSATHQARASAEKLRPESRPARPSSSSVNHPSAANAATKGKNGSRRGSDPHCSIRIGTKPWSEIWIDGKNTNRHTPYIGSVACGDHQLTFKRPDIGLAKTFKVTAVAGDTLTQSFLLRRE